MPANALVQRNSEKFNGKRFFLMYASVSLLCSNKKVLFGHIPLETLYAKYKENTFFGNGCHGLSRDSFGLLLKEWTNEAKGAPKITRKLVSNGHFIDRLFQMFDSNNDGEIDFGSCPPSYVASIQ